MPKNQRPKVTLDELTWKLGTLSQEIQTLGYLLKWQRMEIPVTEKVLSGVGDMLERIGRRAEVLARNIETTQCANSSDIQN